MFVFKPMVLGIHHLKTPQYHIVASVPPDVQSYSQSYSILVGCVKSILIPFFLRKSTIFAG